MPDDTPENSNTEQNNPPANTDTTPDNSGQPDNNPVFTQDDLNRIAGQTRKEASEAARKAILSELGVDNLDSLKAVIQAAQAREDAELSASEKLEKQLLKEQDATKALQAQIDQMQTERILNARQSTLKEFARNAGAQDVAALAVLVGAQKADAFAALFDETNQTTDAKMDKFMKQLQADYSFLFATTGAGSTSNAGGIMPGQAQVEKDVREGVRRKYSKI